MKLNTIELKTARNSCHYWIFNKMVKMPDRGFGGRASIVRVVDRNRQFVGCGIFNPRSVIALRLFADSSENIDRGFFLKKLSDLKNLRENFLRINEDSDCYRLCHSESDGLPGLIIDKYGDSFLIKPYSAGYYGEVMEWLVSSLKELYGEKCGVMVSPDEKACAKDNADYSQEVRKYPAKGRCQVSEFGMKFIVDFESGQKTGFFLDQKLNRRIAAKAAKGLNVLDLCCYTGGFGISMKKAGAKSVTCVDLDKEALEIAKKNAKLNDCDVNFVHMNVFEFLRAAIDKDEKYDMIIVDPAKLAANKLEIPRACRTYGDLNKLAIIAVRNGGLVFTFSCTGLVNEKVHQSIIFNSAAEAGATLKVLMNVGPSPDHPYSSAFPEGKYLKGFLAQVEKSVIKIPLGPAEMHDEV
ncbi:MAG: class I SAM-dependent rRNA methyltransferase [Candidatus Wallbacteria bacterium]